MTRHSAPMRAYCPICRYPQTACLCGSIRPISPKTRLIVLQHPSEVEHQKNSVRVLSLVIPNTEVFVGESTADFAALQQQLALSVRPIYLVYPCERSRSADSLSLENSSSAADCVLLLIDGTWRKAFKILQLNPWLHQYPALHLPEGYGSRYRIRKASRSDSLSTLEAAAYMLSALDADLDVQPLLAAFDAMVDMRIRAMPPEVRLRYGESE